MKKVEDIKNQGIADYIRYISSFKGNDIEKIISEIEKNLNTKLNQQDINLIKALNYVDNVREFVASPDEILGSNATKHGEIAEQIEVNINNARQVINGLKESYTFENVGRLAPEDYINGEQVVQAKFYSDLNGTLNAILEHKEKYDYFGSDGQSYYNMPKDQFEIIEKIINNKNTDDINQRTIETAKRLIGEIEAKTGREFTEVVKPSISKYSEVQIDTVDTNLDNEENSLINSVDLNKKDLERKAEEEKFNIPNNSEPSLAEAIEITAISAGISGGISLGISVLKKKKDGKNISDFKSEDWKEIGLDTGKGTLRGGISGLSIYTLINYAKTPAPLASAYVSATFGIVSLSKDYKKGIINSSEFVENSQLVCIESSFSAIGAAIGSTLIPIPVLGAVVGSIVASTMTSIAKNHLDINEQMIIRDYNKDFIKEMERLEREESIILSELMKKYYELGEISTMAFDFNQNSKLTFEKSIDFARVYDVKEDDILKNIKDIDSYFL